MKSQVINLKGEKVSDISLPSVFDSLIRKDITLKYFESNKYGLKAPYAPFVEAGKRHSASGTISHRRHEWKGHYGKGISRAPRKVMWRRGTQFFWVGAEVSGARGGRKVHSPTGLRSPRKTNKKEMQLAMNSAIASTSRPDLIQKRYSSIKELSIKAPIILDSINNVKSKEFILFLKNQFKELFELVIKIRSERPGKGRKRGRRYKSNAGIILIKSPEEKFKMNGIDVRNVNELEIQDLYPLGRLAIYTEKAIKSMENKK